MKTALQAPALIALAVSAALLAGTAPQAQAAPALVADKAQAEQCQRRSRSTRVEELYPESTRKNPGATPSSRMATRLNRIGDAYEKENYDQVRELADAVLAEERATDYDKAYAAQVAANAAYNADDLPATKAYLQQSIDYDQLDNNSHFQLMHMLAQLQAQDEEYDASLVTLDRYMQESGSQKPEDFGLKGQILYQMERYEDAIPVLKQAVDNSENSNPGMVQALMSAYAETGRNAEATALAEEIASNAPDDKRSQMNLAAMYMQTDQDAKALEVMERLRGQGQLTEDREYRNLAIMYMNQDGGERQAIEVLNEGLEKGVLKPDHDTYNVLAQAYYFSDQPGPAIEAYSKAAPLASNGETYLNLAKVLAGEGRDAEAAQAAQQALDKGVRDPAQARRLLGR